MSITRTFVGACTALALWCGAAAAQNDVEFADAVESPQAVDIVVTDDQPTSPEDSSAATTSDGSSSPDPTATADPATPPPPPPPPPPEPECKEVWKKQDLTCENGPDCDPKNPANPLDVKKCWAMMVDDGKGKKKKECVCKAEDKKDWTCAERMQVVNPKLKDCSGDCKEKNRPGQCGVSNKACICVPKDASCSEKVGLGLACNGRCTTANNKDGECTTKNNACECVEKPPGGGIKIPIFGNPPGKIRGPGGIEIPNPFSRYAPDGTEIIDPTGVDTGGLDPGTEEPPVDVGGEVAPADLGGEAAPVDAAAEVAATVEPGAEFTPAEGTPAE